MTMEVSHPQSSEEEKSEFEIRGTDPEQFHILKVSKDEYCEWFPGWSKGIMADYYESVKRKFIAHRNRRIKKQELIFEIMTKIRRALIQSMPMSPEDVQEITEENAYTSLITFSGTPQTWIRVPDMVNIDPDRHVQDWILYLGAGNPFSIREQHVEQRIGYYSTVDDTIVYYSPVQNVLHSILIEMRKLPIQSI